MTATIEAHGLTKQYGKTTALDGLDLIARARAGDGGARPERGRQDDVRADGGDATASRRGHAAGRRPRRPPGPGRGPPRDRAGGPVRGRRAGDDRPREPRDGRQSVRPEPARREGERRRGARATRTRSRPATGWLARIPAACAGGSTSVRVSSELRGCCCSTSPPPAWILAAGSSCGTRSGRSCSPGPTCC